MSDGAGWIEHGRTGTVEGAVKMDPDRPLESELEWVEANIAAGRGGQEMQDRKRRILDALAKQGGTHEAP